MSRQRYTEGRNAHRARRNTGYVEITCLDGDDATAYQFAEQEYFKITDGFGTEIFYVITNTVGGGVATGTVMTTSSDCGATNLASWIADLGKCVAVRLTLTGSPSSQADLLNELRTAIIHANGHNGTITCSAALTEANGPQTLKLTNDAAGTLDIDARKYYLSQLFSITITRRRGHKKELIPNKSKTRVKPDFTFDHYSIDDSGANFDMHVDGDQVPGRATYRITFEGDPGDGRYIQFEDVLENRAKFRFAGDSASSSTSIQGDHPEQWVKVGYSDWSSTASNVASFLANAINNFSNMNDGYHLSARAVGALLIVKQKFSGPQGNTTVTANLQNVDGGSVFTGGESNAQAPFSKRFQLVRTPALSGDSLRLNDLKTQG